MVVRDSVQRSQLDHNILQAHAYGEFSPHTRWAAYIFSFHIHMKWLRYALIPLKPILIRIPFQEKEL